MLDDGSIFDSSEGCELLVFILGFGQVIKGFDDGVIGMSVGEEKIIYILCEDVYGLINFVMMQDVLCEQILDEIFLELGMMLQMQGQVGDVIFVKVVNIMDDNVMLDVNYMLVGKDLIFVFKLVSIGVLVVVGGEEKSCDCC